MHSDCGQDRSNLDTSYMNNKHGNAGAAKGEKPQVAATSESSSGEWGDQARTDISSNVQ